jgi:inorganic pyrophosphatase
MILPPVFTDEKNAVNVVIETPRNSPIKYKYDETGKYFKLDKFLPLGLAFPLDFGFIPHTKAEDGDPLDVLVLLDFPVYPGIIVECRMIGVITAEQKEKRGKYKRNDRFIAVALKSLCYAETKTIEDLSSTFLKGLITFFEHYNDMQDRKFKVLKIENSSRAIELISKGSNSV